MLSGKMKQIFALLFLANSYMMMMHVDASTTNPASANSTMEATNGTHASAVDSSSSEKPSGLIGWFDATETWVKILIIGSLVAVVLLTCLACYFCFCTGRGSSGSSHPRKGSSSKRQGSGSRRKKGSRH